MKRKILWLLSFVFVFKIGAQTTFNVQKMDSLFASIESHNKGMGSLALLKNGNIIYQKAIGTAHFKGQKAVAATPETRYRVGSITKMFTSVLIFQLIEEKKLTLATPLDQFFKDIPNAKNINIGLMLNHRSGIFNITEADDYVHWSEEKQTRETMTKRMSAQTPAFAPDEKSEYSNSNYILLGYIAEMLTNQTLEKLVEERICKKIGLKNTYIGDKTDIEKNECFSYSFTGKKWVQETETDMTVPQGAGALVATATDLGLFLEALFAEKLVQKTSLEQMKTMNEKIGFGLFMFPFNDKKSFGHTGGIDGFFDNPLCKGRILIEKLHQALIDDGGNDALYLAVHKLVFGLGAEAWVGHFYRNNGDEPFSAVVSSEGGVLVFEDFIDGMANVNIAIGIGWAIVQNEFGFAFSRRTNALVKFFILPLF